jgi:hypothetical protein
MYVKIRTDGALGLGRGTEGNAEITIGYGEAHMIAAALDKLAQTARKYEQTYKKTTTVGGGSKIEFLRSDDGTITIAGDGHKYFCTEKEVRTLSEQLKHLPPIEVAPSSDYVNKIKPEGEKAVVIKNGGQSVTLSLPEAAVLRTAIGSSMDSRFFQEKITMGKTNIVLERSSDIKWKIQLGENVVKFTAYEVEAVVAGLHNAILDVLMDLVKSFGTDKLADIRVKSQVQHVEQKIKELFEDDKSNKGVDRHLTKTTRDILGIGVDAEERTRLFIDLCNWVYSNLDPSVTEPIYSLLSKTFVAVNV